MILVLALTAGLLSAPSTKDLLTADLASLPTHRSLRGDEQDRRGLQLARHSIAEHLRSLGLETRLQEVPWIVPHSYEPGEYAPPPPVSYNIIAEKTGDDPDLAPEVLIIGAHYDTVLDSPGADDNASGVVALLHVARVISEKRYRRTIRLVFFTGEEVGLIGSARYAASVASEFHEHEDAKGNTIEAKKILIGMVSLESIGFYSDAPGSQKSPMPPIKGVFEPPTVGNFLALTGIAKHQNFSRAFASAMKEASPSIQLFSADFFPLPIPDIMRSDHAPFLLRGLPAVMLTDTANFRNPNYHKPTDVVATLDLDRLAIAAEAVAGATEALAERSSK
jgi:hypothetical protein